MVREYLVVRAVSGGNEKFRPYRDLDAAIAKGCELLKTHGLTAVVSIDDDANNLIVDAGQLRVICERLSRSQLK